jgi:hypothetical protein
MSEVILFNHIPKTAGSTMYRVLLRTVGRERVLFSTELRRHSEAVGAIADRLDRPLEDRYAVAAHTGCGVERRLPTRHSYTPYTVLRDPVQRTLSNFYHVQDRRGPTSGMSLEDFLEHKHLHSFNSQTAFLGGLTARHHLEGEPLDPRRIDRALLAQAKHNLAAHDVVGLTERFDETLLLLGDAYGWTMPKTLYRRANVGTAHRRAVLSPAQLEAVAANNELDAELYEYACQLFEERLARQIPDRSRRLRRFRRMNAAFGRAYPIVHPPARVLASGVRRLQTRPPAPA